MDKQTVINELINFINQSINARIENDLSVIKEQLINKAYIYLSLLNEEYNTKYIIDIETLVNSALYKDVTRKELSYIEIRNKVQQITNMFYSYISIEYDLINGADDIGYNDKSIYFSNGWEDIEINFKYYLTNDNDIIVYSIDKV